MIKQLFTFLLFAAIWVNPLQAQIDGDNIFGSEQIITIDLDFSQTGFWDSLVLNYDSETYMKADLTLTDASGVSTFTDIGIRLKGNSSYGHPGNKKSFKIDFNKYVTGQNYDGLKKLNFSNAFKDPSLMREKLFFDVCREANVLAPRASFANVYFNETLWGFYTVVEQIDDQFLDWAILDDDGNLFKAGANFGGGPGGSGNAADLKYYGDDQADYEERYELKTNEDDNNWSDLIALTDFIDNSSTADFESGLADQIELEEYLRSAALDNLFSNLDSYTESARNYYIYHNLTTSKWEWIKWDGNEAFGSYAPGLGDVTTLALDFHGDDRPLLENIFDSPQLYGQYQTQLCDLTEQFFNTDYMNPKIDAMKTLIQSSVYADGNKMYTDANFDDNIENDISTGGGPGGGNIYGLKSFVQERSDFVANQLDCTTAVDLVDAGTTSSFPNPFNSTVLVNWEKEQFNSLKVYNSLGAEVYQATVKNTNSIELDLSFLNSGTYFLRLFSEDRAIASSGVIGLVKI
jgi:spore coat protein CotH